MVMDGAYTMSRNIVMLSGSGGLVTIGGNQNVLSTYTGNMTLQNDLEVFAGGRGSSETAIYSAFDNSEGHVVHTAGGVVDFYGVQTHGAGAVLSVDQGSVNLNTDAGGDGGSTPNLAVKITDSGARAFFNVSQHLASLKIENAVHPADPILADATLAPSAGPKRVVVVGSLSLATGATFNLTNNVAIDNYSGTTPFATLNGLIKSAYNAGQWGGSGIDLSFSGDTSAFRNIGIVDNATLPPAPANLGASGAPQYQFASFAGESVGSSSILMAYTKTGDANLDGVTDITDFPLFIDSYKSAETGPMTWFGDYDHDGLITLDKDFPLFVAAYLGGGGTAPALLQEIGNAPLSQPEQQLLAAAVPEPHSLALIGVGLAGCLRRRRFAGRA